MTPEFPASLHEWHDFYLLVGTAAATMVGLLFVSLSFNIDLLLHDSRTHLLAMARQAFHVFLTVLVISLISLMPAVSMRVVGAQLAVIGGILFVASLRNLVRFRRHGDETISRRVLMARTLGPIIGGFIVVLVGVQMLRGHAEDMVLLASVTLLLIGSAAGSSWDLLVRVARARERRPEGLAAPAAAPAIERASDD